MCESGVISSIRVVSFNTRGLKNVTIPSLFDRFDIVLLQETLQCKQDLGQLNSLSPLFQGTGVAVTDLSSGILRGRPRGGVAILWRRSLNKFVNEINFDLDWIAGISLNFPNENAVYIISVYLPCNSRENEDEFLEKLGILASIINDLDSPFVWVLGDFNAHLGPNPSKFGKYLSDLCLENDLKISSKELLKNDSFTYISERWESTSWLDHCVSTEGAHERIENFNIEYDLSARDHIPISFVFTINNNISINVNLNHSTQERIDWDSLTPDQILEYQVRCETLLREIDFPAHSFAQILTVMTIIISVITASIITPLLMQFIKHLFHWYSFLETGPNHFLAGMIWLDKHTLTLSLPSKNGGALESPHLV